ncbi:hypothetical protein EI94DRAFT_480254 [Lactarius quietus]|nr:hypothetical protein EI94DRAFT_480254 [Lactarius quietus]
MQNLFEACFHYILHAQTSNIVQSEIQDTNVQDAIKKLWTHDEIIAIIKTHLEARWEIEDDGSHDLTNPPSNRNLRKKRRDECSENLEPRIHASPRYRRFASISRSKESFSSQTITCTLNSDTHTPSPDIHMTTTVFSLSKMQVSIRSGREGLAPQGKSRSFACWIHNLSSS